MDAHHRRDVADDCIRSTAMFEMDKFEGAKRAFEKCLEFDPNNARCKTWIRKCDSELDSSQTSKPAQQEEEEEEKKARPQEKKAMETERESAYVAKEQVPQQEVVTKAPTAKDRIKHNFYQINDQVVLSIIGLRNVAQDTRHVTIDTEKVDVSIDLPDGDKWEKTFELLYPVKPDESSFKHSPVKTEITLIKQDASIEWKVLEKSEAALKMQDSRDPKLFYPSSKGDKDWDGVEKEVTASLETEKPEGDAALNQLFQSIYSNASDEARRAMIKSFTESGGTVLSTNWEEVSQKRVEVSPPDGMEKRTWNEK